LKTAGGLAKTRTLGNFKEAVVKRAPKAPGASATIPNRPDAIGWPANGAVSRERRLGAFNAEVD
jgi:hypothetical protein